MSARFPTPSRSVQGLICGLIAAFGYTAANMALRDLSRPNDLSWAVWILHWKAIPAAVTAWAIIVLRASRGMAVKPTATQFRRLFFAGLLMQFGGNLMFQYSLGQGGLVLTVPITFATLITSAAWMSRLVLGEPITPRSIGAMSLLIVAIVLLSVGGQEASLDRSSSPWTLASAIVTAAIAGFAYGSAGVFIRQSLSQQLSLSTTLAFFSTLGVITMGLWCAIGIGWVDLWNQSSGSFVNLVLAGVFNCVAFFAVAAALERISVTRTNLINATQIALCALAGVIFFAEPMSISLGVGIGLTIAGLLLMESRRAPRDIAAADEPELISVAE